MATFTRTPQDGGSWLYVWQLTTADPKGDPICHPGGADKSIQFLASVWGGATAVAEGSNKAPAAGGTITVTDTDYAPITDPQGNAISKTADAVEALTENTLYLRPRLSTVGAAAVVNVYLLVRGTM